MSKYYGPNCRFDLVERLHPDYGTVVVVHDADWIRDVEVRQGHRSPIVHEAESLEAAQEWCDKVLEGSLNSYPLESEYKNWPELRERVNAARAFSAK